MCYIPYLNLLMKQKTTSFPDVSGLKKNIFGVSSIHLCLPSLFLGDVLHAEPLLISSLTTSAVLGVGTTGPHSDGFSPAQETPVGQFPALAPAAALHGRAARQPPERRAAEPAAACVPAAPDGHHGEALHVQQARLDLVRSALPGVGVGGGVGAGPPVCWS